MFSSMDVMHKILVFCCVIYYTKVSSRPQSSFYEATPLKTPSPKDDVEVFAPLIPGAYVPKPRPLPFSPVYPAPSPPYYPFAPASRPPYTPQKPTYGPNPRPPCIPAKPTYNPNPRPPYTPPKASRPPYTPQTPTYGPNPRPPYIPAKPTYNPNPRLPYTPPKPPYYPITKPSINPDAESFVPGLPQNPKKPTSNYPYPSFYPITTQKPVSFPFYPSIGEKTTTVTNMPHLGTTEPWRSQSKWETPRPPSTKTTSTPNLFTTSKSSTSWIYPPKPIWRRPGLKVSNDGETFGAASSLVTEVTQFDGVLSEYQGYNEYDGSFKFSFDLNNGLSAKVHGYNKNGRQIIEGSYSLFTQDGKPVNIVYNADENIFLEPEPEPTNFHVKVPKNFNFENEPKVIDYLLSDTKSDQIRSVVADDDEDEQSSIVFYRTNEKDDGSEDELTNLILSTTTESEISLTTEVSVDLL